MYPRLLHIYGPIWIHSYGLMIAVGFLVFVYFLYNNPKRSKLISDELFFNSLFLGLLSGVAGGRAIFVLYEWDLFKDNVWQVFYPWVGGFGILGSIIGVIICLSIYFKLNKVPVLNVFDLVGMYAGLLEGFGRIGCFMAGCCYGMPASLTCACSVQFSNVHGLAPLGIPLHPAQLYSSLASFLVFIIVYLRAKYLPYKKGEIIFTFLALSSTSRFILDFFRGDRDFIVDFYLLSYYQIVAVFIFVISIFALIYLHRKK